MEERLDDYVLILPANHPFKLSSLAPHPVIEIEDLYLPSVVHIGSHTMSRTLANKLLAPLISTFINRGSEEEVQVTTSGRPLPPPFFRYSRPEDPKNNHSPAPKGGSAFLIDLNPETKEITFSVAVCHERDHFNRKAARNICKERFENDQTFRLKGYNPDFCVLYNIKKAFLSLLEEEEGMEKEVDKDAPVIVNFPPYMEENLSQGISNILKRI